MMNEAGKMKKICILLGSPRKNGNTEQLIRCFRDEAEKLGCETRTYRLYEMDLRPCAACRECQKDRTGFGCPLEDEMQVIFDAITWCDLIVIGSPVYSWYCTPPTKAVLDRMVYGMNKYYGDEEKKSLWAGKELAVITTCGYPPEKGADLWEEGIKRYCRHSRLTYRGMLAERHLGYGTVFMDEGKAGRAAAFGRKLCER